MTVKVAALLINKWYRKQQLYIYTLIASCDEYAIIMVMVILTPVLEQSEETTTVYKQIFRGLLAKQVSVQQFDNQTSGIMVHLHNVSEL